MDYRFLGKSGLKISELCFGVMTFGGSKGWGGVGSASISEARELVDTAIDHGVNIFDTADIYHDGQSEEVLGQVLAGRREEVVIITKCGFRMKPGPMGDGLSRIRIIEACEASLKRLQTDYIDLYLLHSFDFLTPLEETLSALDLLVQQGKVRYVGCSNFTAWELMKALALQDKHSWQRFIGLQAYYSPAGRDIELELVPLCLDQGLGIMTWSPLHGGFLSGKYRREQPWPEGTRLSGPGDHLPFDIEKGYDLVDAMAGIAEKREVSVAQVALNWQLRKLGIATIVIGARNKQQLRDNLQASEWQLEPEEVADLDTYCPPPNIYPHWYFQVYRKDRMLRRIEYLR